MCFGAFEASSQTQSQLTNFVCLLKSAPPLTNAEAKDARSHMERCFPTLTRVIYDESLNEFSLISNEPFSVCQCLESLQDEGYFIGVVITPNTQMTLQNLSGCEHFLYQHVRERWMNGTSTEKDE
jgi:hypothetical protein